MSPIEYFLSGQASLTEQLNREEVPTLIDTILATVAAAGSAIATTLTLKDRYAKWRTRKRRPRRNVPKSRKH